jgi:hypothetical protein
MAPVAKRLTISDAGSDFVERDLGGVGREAELEQPPQRRLRAASSLTSVANSS